MCSESLYSFCFYLKMQLAMYIIKYYIKLKHLKPCVSPVKAKELAVINFKIIFTQFVMPSYFFLGRCVH